MIRQVVYDKSGISLGENKEALIRSRIAKRMRKLNISTYDEYIDFVNHDETDSELENMLDAISTNTTNFYREAAHFDFMRTILKDWLKNDLKKLRIWCAAGSSGEEPYTLAIEALDSNGLPKTDVKILATDIAPSVLKTAITGIYSESKTSSIPKHLRNQYFDKIKQGTEFSYKAQPILKNILMFRQMNLALFPYPFKNSLDMIFCRNVMIYFDNGLRVKMVEEFRRLLRPGGYLFIGHAESISNFSAGFKCIKPSIYIRL
ncbi:MAG: protein-glutamate O-methyltransferase CheR [Candidatus Zixiibacteriota bacterium]